ncbi:MAG: TetR/AcrR family transcriptional regulator [Sandaracinaceae bacterium]|nr:TetR/AcrR family transcriptional regulator [Sandaracinaceae bacterium]
MVNDGYHHGDLRAALVEAALEALERDGELPSWRGLARTCGVSQSAPYRHFASLDALRVAVVVEGFRRLTEAIDAAKAREVDPFARLAAGTRAYIEFGRRNRALYGLMFRLGSDAMRDRDAAAAGQAAFATLVEALGRCGVRDTLRAALVTWTAQHGIVDMIRAGLHPALGDADAIVEPTLEMIVGYVRGVLAAEQAGAAAPARVRAPAPAPRRPAKKRRP